MASASACGATQSALSAWCATGATTTPRTPRNKPKPRRLKHVNSGVGVWNEPPRRQVRQVLYCCSVHRRDAENAEVFGVILCTQRRRLEYANPKEPLRPLRLCGETVAS